MSYNTIFHKEVSDVFIGVSGLARVPKTDPSCMTVIRYPLEPPSFTHTRYRCEKTVFLEVLATMVPTSLAQVVLTLRFVFFHSNGLVLIVAEQNLCRHEQESVNHLMLQYNNDIAVQPWPIHDCLCGKGRM